MDLKQFGGLVAGIAVAALLLAAVVVPIIDSTSHTGAAKITNTGLKDMRAVDADVTMVLSNTNTIIVDDETITGYGYPAVMSDTVWIAINNGGMNIFYFDGENAGWSAMGGANVAIDFETKTISLTDIVQPGSNWNLDSTSLELTYEMFCFVPTLSGEWISATSNLSDLRVNNADQYFAISYKSGTLHTIANNVYYQDGVAQEGDALTLTEGTSPGIYSVTMNTELTSPVVIVPKVVWGNSSLSPTELQLLQLIPLLITVGIIMAVVTMVISRRD